MQKLLLSLFVSAILNAGSSSLSLLENKPSINIFKKKYNTLPNPKLIFSLAYKYNSVENHYNKLKNSFGFSGGWQWDSSDNSFWRFTMGPFFFSRATIDNIEAKYTQFTWCSIGWGKRTNNGLNTYFDIGVTANDWRSPEEKIYNTAEFYSLSINLHLGYFQATKAFGDNMMGSIYYSKPIGEKLLEDGPKINSNIISVEGPIVSIPFIIIGGVAAIAAIAMDETGTTAEDIMPSTSSYGGSKNAVACGVYGRIKFVDFGEDYRVKFVDISPDVRVQTTSISSAYTQFSPGKWHIVDHNEDYKLKIVTFGEDFTAKYVSFGEGCN